MENRQALKTCCIFVPVTGTVRHGHNHPTLASQFSNVLDQPDMCVNFRPFTRAHLVNGLVADFLTAIGLGEIDCEDFIADAMAFVRLAAVDGGSLGDDSLEDED